MKHIHEEEEFKFRGSTYLIGGKGEGGRESKFMGENSYLIVLKKLAIG